MRNVALALATVGAAFGAAMPAQAAERPGELEASIASFQLSRIEGVDVAGGGSIVVAGRSLGYPLHHPWVRAYLPSGVPDPAFGEGGTVQLEDDRREVVEALVQSDGRLVIAQSSPPFEMPAPAVVSRMTAQGERDSTFGGTGSIQPDLGAPSSAITDIALRLDGRLIVAGTRAESSSAPVVIVVRGYMPDGSPDTSFGTNGTAEIHAGTDVSPVAAALQPDGGVVVTASRRGVPMIARLSTDGQLDRAFGGGGLAPVQLGNSDWREQVHPAYGASPAVVLRNGRIRLALAFKGPRGRGYRMGLVGLTKTGHPDRRFGVRGRALGPRPQPADSGEAIRTAIGDRRGGVLVAGTFWDGRDLSFDSSAVVRRFRADGTLDRSFGRRGVVRTPPAAGIGYPVIEQQLALAGDRLVVGQHTWDGKYGFWGDATLRLLHAGYDDDPPRISISVYGCRSVRVRVSDLSALDRVVVRAGRRVIRRSSQKRFRVRVRGGTRRISVRATDLARNSSRVSVRLPRC